MKITATMVFTVLISCTGAFCQLSTSSWMINGEIGYQSMKENGANESTGLLTFNPKVGYLVSKSLMVGADFNILSISSGDDTYTQNLIGPFIRFYSNMSEGSSIAFFGEGSYGFGSEKFKTTGNTDSDRKNGWSLGAGLAAFLGERVALEPVIRYGSTKTKLSPSSDSKVNTLEFLIGLSVYLGKGGSE